MSAPGVHTRRPHVSVVVPAKDCAALLPQCLAAVDAQTYRGPLDITVALAPSRDGTELVLSTARLERPLQVIDNPSGTTSAGLNAAVAACAGEVVARVDAQSRIPPEYIERSLATLAATSAANVGGIQHPVGATGLERAIAAALASPFGGGPARFRGSQRDGPADTVYMGVFDRAALDSVGGFDETLERNQDYDLNWRLRQNGHVVWLDTGLVVDYVPRSGYAALARQYFDYGRWKRAVLLRHPRSLRPRQLAAPALVVGLAVSAVALARRLSAGGALPLLYVCAVATAAARLKPKLPAGCDRVRAAGAFAVMHLSWGSGFLAGPAGRRARRQPGAQRSR